MNKYKFFIGPEHHKTHLDFTQRILGGEYIFAGKRIGNTYDLIKDHDNKNVVWFFADLYKDVIPYIKGKIVLIPHGLGFKPYLSGERIDILNNYVDQVWSTGRYEEEKYRIEKIPMTKIQRIGYTPLFSIPNVPNEINSVFVSIGWFFELISWEKKLDFIKKLPPDLTIYISTHPSMPNDIQQKFIDLCNLRENLNFVGTEEEMMKVYAICNAAIVGLSSVATPFFFLGKPVIFLKGRNRFPFFQWQRLRQKIRINMFFKILSESTRLVEPKTISKQTILNAKVAPSGKKIFYDTNWDKNKTIELICKAVDKL